MNRSPRIGNASGFCGRGAHPVASPLLLVIVLCAMAGMRARGDEASVSAGLIDAAVDAGQPAEYHIDITNGRPDEAPPAPNVEGLSISYVHEMEARKYNFGAGFHNSSVYTYIYSIETARPGLFVIPGQDVQVNHETLHVLPVTLNVMGAGGATGGLPDADSAAGRQASQSCFAELVIPRKSAYIGESIPAELREYFGMDVQAQIDPNVILNGDGFSVQKFTGPRQSVVEVEGQQFRLVTFKTALAGVKTGNISVGPAETSPVVRLPRTQNRRHSTFNDPIDQPFFGDSSDSLNRAPPKEITLRTGSVTVEIRPLPPGRPSDFSGAIGQFKLDAEIVPRKAATGDPLTVRLSLQGKGNFDRIEPPVLTDELDLRTYPATSKFKADDDVGLSGLKTFEQVVIADHARTSLPGYRFDYFDPATGRYQTLRTPPAAVAITGADLTTPTPDSPPANATAPAPRATPAPAPGAPEDILPIRRDFGQRQGFEAFLPLYRRVGFWKLQGVVALGILVWGAILQWRRRARNEAIRQAADLKRQRARLDRQLRGGNTSRRAFYSAACRLAQLKAATATNRPAADLTPLEISEAQRLPPDVAGSVAELFQRHDELVYSGNATTQEPVPPEERRAILATLESLEKNR